MKCGQSSTRKEAAAGQPVAAPRVRHPARLGLLIVALLAAFACGALVAVAWDALSDINARGQMDPTR